MDQATLNRRLAAVAPQAQALSDKLDADVIFYNGAISYWSAKYFLNQCRKRKRKRKNAVLVIVTGGGDPNAAYRIARHLQEKYSNGKIYAMVTGQCKSAGTLVVTGAHEIFMGDFGELGPLDVQLTKKDELWEEASGLNIDEALRTLEKKGETIFLDYLSTIKKNYRSVTFRTACDVSIALTEKILAPIAAQIDPREIGENSRAMDIAKNYAARLDRVSDNLAGSEALEFLISSYPNHGFVIDMKEASTIFKRVLPFSAEMSALDEALSKLAREPVGWDNDGGEAFDVQFLSAEPAAEAPAQPQEQQPALTVVEAPEAGAGQ